MRATSMRKLAGWAGNESGVAMMFIIMATLLISTITVTVMQIVAADLVGGVRELQADQVQNIAQAGVHYAIGKLQASGAGTYTGETLSITSGTTTLGTATITVSCIDTGLGPAGSPGCSGTYSAYRRIISKGSLSALAAPTRTVVAVVQDPAGGGGGGGVGSTTGICTLSSGVASHGSGVTVTINGDIASNGSVNLSAGSGTTISLVGDTGSPQQYTGKATATSTINCPSGCSAAGGLFPNQPGPLCSSPTMPTFAPGSTPLTVAAGTVFTMDGTSGHGYTWGDVNLSGGSCSGAQWSTDLQIQTSTTDSTATTVVQVNSLTFGSCARLVILGVGKVDLRIGDPINQSFNVYGDKLKNAPDHFGVTSADTQSSVQLVPASRLTVWLNSAGTGTQQKTHCYSNLVTGCAGYIQYTNFSGTFIGPTSPVQVKDNPTLSKGAFLTNQFALTDNSTFTQDVSGLSGALGGGGGGGGTNFTTLKSWKDQ